MHVMVGMAAPAPLRIFDSTNSGFLFDARNSSPVQRLFHSAARHERASDLMDAGMDRSTNPSKQQPRSDAGRRGGKHRRPDEEKNKNLDEARTRSGGDLSGLRSGFRCAAAAESSRQARGSRTQGAGTRASLSAILLIQIALSSAAGWSWKD